MDTVLQATVRRIKTVEEDTDKTLSNDLEYVINSIAKQETKFCLIRDNLIETCFSHCKSDHLSPSHYVQCLQILQQLAVLLSVREQIISSDSPSFIPNISDLLHSDDENVRFNACKLVSTICSFQDSITKMAHSPITEILYDLLFDSSYIVVSEALNSFSFITNYIRNTPEKVVQKIIEILSRTDKKDVNRCKSNMKCLWNMCSSWEIKELAIKHGAVDAIPKFLSMAYAKQQYDVCRCATGLLMPISVCESGKDAIIASSSVIGSLAYLASNQSINDEIKSNSAIVLCNISDHPKGLQKAGKELIHKHALIIELFGKDKAAQIGHFYMKEEKALTQQSAVQLLGLVGQQKEGGLDAVWKCLNILPELIVIFMTNERERIMSMALDCIISLTQHNDTAQRILRKEARRSQPFLETARKIPELQPFLKEELM